MEGSGDQKGCTNGVAVIFDWMQYGLKTRLSISKSPAHTLIFLDTQRQRLRTDVKGEVAWKKWIPWAFGGAHIRQARVAAEGSVTEKAKVVSFWASDGTDPSCGGELSQAT